SCACKHDNSPETSPSRVNLHIEQWHWMQAHCHLEIMPLHYHRQPRLTDQAARLPERHRQAGFEEVCDAACCSQTRPAFVAAVCVLEISQSSIRDARRRRFSQCSPRKKPTNRFARSIKVHMSSYSCTPMHPLFIKRPTVSPFPPQIQ